MFVADSSLKFGFAGYNRPFQYIVKDEADGSLIDNINSKVLLSANIPGFEYVRTHHILSNTSNAGSWKILLSPRTTAVSFPAGR